MKEVSKGYTCSKWIFYGYVITYTASAVLPFFKFTIPGDRTSIAAMLVTLLALVVSFCLSYSGFIMSVPERALKRYWKEKDGHRGFTDRFQFDVRIVELFSLFSMLWFFVAWFFAKYMKEVLASSVFYDAGVVTSMWNIAVTVYFYSVLGRLHQIAYEEKVKLIEPEGSAVKENLKDESKSECQVDIKSKANRNIDLTITDDKFHLEINKME